MNVDIKEDTKNMEDSDEMRQRQDLPKKHKIIKLI